MQSSDMKISQMFTGLGICLVSVCPEIGKLGRDQGFRTFLPEAYGVDIVEDKNVRITQISDKLAISGWALVTGLLKYAQHVYPWDSQFGFVHKPGRIPSGVFYIYR